jgi:hypothetical protein
MSGVPDAVTRLVWIRAEKSQDVAIRDRIARVELIANHLKRPDPGRDLLGILTSLNELRLPIADHRHR